MATYILGDFAKLYLKEFGSTGSWVLIGCTTGDNFAPNTELAEITSPDNAFVEVLPTYKSATLSSDSMLMISPGNDTYYATSTLLQWQKDDEKLDFLYTYNDGTDSVNIIGSCYISSLNISASSNDYANVQIVLQCTGEWDITFF